MAKSEHQYNLHLKTLTIVFFATLYTTTSQARFHHEDANHIDSDANLGTEYYNDLVSYRWPYSWRKSWDQSHSGFRVTAGSLTMTRFFYQEDIKLDPIPTNPMSVAFEQHRFEDFAEMEETREVRVGFKVLPSLRLFLLGDGSALKEYGDVGAGVRLFESEWMATDVLYWSVDHYYNEKNHEPGAYRSDQTKTWIFRSYNLDPSSTVRWQVHVENDLPFKWVRPSQGVYDYERRKVHMKFAVANSPQSEFFIDVSTDSKNESWSTMDTTKNLSFQRRVNRSELGVEGGDSAHNYSISVDFITRESLWRKTGEGVDQMPWSVAPYPLTSQRREIGFYGYSHLRISPTTVFTSGLVSNKPEIIEDSRTWNEYEIKAVTAYHWDFSDKSGFALNATWDIDQLGRDYPYTKHTFRPWGGGNIQAFLVF
jgi:hypothetical protein